jgi:flagellar export protein FliJ
VKAFRFPLESALALRRRQCEAEERKLELALAALRELDARRESLAREETEARAAVVASSSPSPQELWSLSQYLARARREQNELAVRRWRQEEAVAAQRACLVEARRKFRLLEQLKEERLAEWRREFARELETLAAEAYLARWHGR